jgi:threonine/homoserine/homoserine lactone efflux protein
MSLSFFVKGLAIGLAIAAPVGAIGVLCIRRTLADGRAHGFVSGLGAATADALYGSIAAFGLTFVSSFLLQWQLWLRVVGGLFLLALGVRTLLQRPRDAAAAPSGSGRMGLLGAYFSTLALTITNPLTILSFAAVFAGMGIGGTGGDYGAAALMVLGVFSGSALWWLILSSGVGLFRARFGPRGLLWVNRLSGLIIAGFGAAVLISLLAGQLVSQSAGQLVS